MSISVIIPTYNEENFIQQAIDSAAFADEILVIDSYSTDKTTTIVSQNNCNLIQRTFDNFSNQKNHAIKHAKNDWIMILDADELLLPKLQQEIADAVHQKGFVAFEIPRHNFFINKFLAFGSNRNETLIRVFNRNYCHYEGLVHEKLVYQGTLGTLKNFMLHYTYKSLEHFISKKNKYSHLQSQQLLKKKKKATWFHILIKPLFRFFNELILRRGVFDGIPGLTTTTMNAYGVLSRYIKLRTHQGKTKLPDLIDYDTYNDTLTQEARTIAKQYQKKKSPGLLSFLVIPPVVFFRFYILKLNMLKGIDGYAFSFLQAFKSYKALIYRWLEKRNLE